MSYAAYGRTQNVTENPRSIEYRLLGQVTGALLAAKDDPDKRKLYDALLWNQQVWNAFLVDLTSPGNQLPQALKQQITGLCLWVRRETDDVIAGKAEIETLVAVNRNIMEGLR
jgi:flagellar protein FlaF